MNIVLIGPRCSGKSTVGRILADRLHWRLVDTDAAVAADAGASIAEIFAREGESGFRARESAAVRRAAGEDEQVIAVGGGAATIAENVQALRANGRVVWLRAPPDVLYQRMSAAAETHTLRPPLTQLPPADEIAALVAQREPHYRAACDFSIDAHAATPQALADEILARLHDVLPR